MHQDEAHIDGKETLRRSLSGGHWYLANMIMQKVFSFGTFFVTARLLTPADFGLVTIAAIFPSLVDPLTAIAFETGLIPLKEGSERKYLDVIWTFNILRGIVVALIVFLTAPLVASFFDHHDALLLFMLGGVTPLLQGFANIGQVYFARKLAFEKDFFRDLAMYASIAIVSIGGAYLYHSYWALFWGSASGILAATIATYFLDPYRPRLNLRFGELRPLLRYGSFVYGQELLHQAALATENVLVGRFAGASNIGLYTKAKGLSGVLTTAVSSIIGKVGFSAFASVQDSLAYVREGYYKSFDLVAATSLPFAALIYFEGDRIVEFLLGEKWLPMVPLLQLFLIPITLDALFSSLARTITNAIGKPEYHFRLNIAYVLGNTLFLFLLVPKFGATGGAVALSIAALITNGYAIRILRTLIGFSYMRVVESLAISGLALVLPVVSVEALLRFFSATSFGWVAFGALSGGILYVAGLFVLFRITNKGPYPTLALIAGRRRSGA